MKWTPVKLRVVWRAEVQYTPIKFLPRVHRRLALSKYGVQRNHPKDLAMTQKDCGRDLIFFKITETEFGELKQSMLYERFENREWTQRLLFHGVRGRCSLPRKWISEKHTISSGRYTKENGKKGYVTEHPKLKLCWWPLPASTME